MIVNDKYKFVFVHIPKNAGTSCRSALSQLDGENRVAVASGWHETYSEFRVRYEIRTGCSDSVLDDYLVFAVVRDPIARFVSLHRYLLRTHRHVYPLVPESVNRFVDVVVDHPGWLDSIRSLRPQHEFIGGADVLIGRFEDLHDGFDKFCSTLGVSLTLRHLNSSSGLGEASRRRSVFRSVRQLAGSLKRRKRSSECDPGVLDSLSKSKLMVMYSKDMDAYEY